jgi:hypothetical protein
MMKIAICGRIIISLSMSLCERDAKKIINETNFHLIFIHVEIQQPVLVQNCT